MGGEDEEEEGRRDRTRRQATRREDDAKKREEKSEEINTRAEKIGGRKERKENTLRQRDQPQMITNAGREDGEKI